MKVKRLLLTLIIWIICFIAIVSGVVLTYTWLRNQGPMIHISFDDASGMVPNQTPISYRGVYMGWVRDVSLDPQTGRAIVTARMTHEAKNMLGEGTEFWVVRADFSLGHANNLGTIASGDYIGMNPKHGKTVKQFMGLDYQPPGPELTNGLKVLIRASDVNGVNISSPILYKGLRIGEVGDMSTTDDKRRILITAYIYKQYSSLVRTSSCFVNASGFHASFHIFGASNIDVSSFKTLLNGGIVMSTPDMQAPAPKADAVFDLRPVPTQS